ncbi:MAG: hypothetical protein HFP81_00560 [Methylococcales symbiont of Hymedesmia sp. n. MRB-2018]|nr:MAG: hypothetical protein HFP81_00560 [Methylococcales symbiont of Hymedesmia sp. n. MRB-2018]
MSKKDFDKFISKQAEPDDTSIDWGSKKNKWINHLSNFYERIEVFLEEYVKDGKVVHKYTEKTLFEEYIGNYSVRVLNIELGNHKVRLEPIGTILIGAEGRVDLIGANGKVKFVLVNKNSSGPKIKVSVWVEGEDPPEKDVEPAVVELDWKIATPPPNIKYINLEQDTFLEVLMEVLGG